MNENDLSFLIRGAAFKVHSALGPGLLESVYEVALSHELKTRACPEFCVNTDCV